MSIKFNTLKEILDIFGFEFEYHKLTEEDREVYQNWLDARSNKDFEKADYYRNLLVERHIL